MTLKEQAYAIIDSITEKQLKGVVDLFSEPEIGDKRRETDRILKKLARIHLGMGYLELGHSYIMAHLCVHTAAL